MRDDEPYFSPGRWGFMEAWPPNAKGPVYDLCYGDVHVARVFMDADGWRVTMRRHEGVSSELESLVYVVNLLRERMEAFEKGQEEKV